MSGDQTHSVSPALLRVAEACRSVSDLAWYLLQEYGCECNPRKKKTCKSHDALLVLESHTSAIREGQIKEVEP